MANLTNLINIKNNNNNSNSFNKTSIVNEISSVIVEDVKKNNISLEMKEKLKFIENAKSNLDK